jgi:hypothetical protein
MRIIITSAKSTKTQALNSFSAITRTKAPDDSVTVDLASRKLVHYQARNLGHPNAAKKINAARTEQASPGGKRKIR